MNGQSRRQFLADVGRGMLVGGLGAATAFDMGLASARADESGNALTFGALEPLVGMMQDTGPAALMPMLTQKLKDGTSLKTLVAAGALANARSFGGQDYDGYHALMALSPALAMAEQLSDEQKALPVLKVLYRNTNRIQQHGGRKKEVLKHSLPAVAESPAGDAIRTASRAGDFAAAERALAGMMRGPVGEAYNHLQFAVQDEVDVHRVVLAWRSYALLDVCGASYADTLLRQSVRYCVNEERQLKERNRPTCAIRTLLPKLFDQYKLDGRAVGGKSADDAWVEELAQTIYASNRERSAEAVAAALAEGMAPAAIAEAMSLAATRLVLRDPGRDQGSGDKPKGSVHGASVGVHASDSANAWRHIAAVSNPRNTFASLIVGAYHTAGQAGRQNPTSLPTPEQLDAVRTVDPAELLRQTEEAIRAKDQPRTCALVAKYGSAGGEAKPMFNLMLKYAVSEDGALHAEKYYNTVAEEYVTTRPNLRWQHMIALGRVTASEFGYPAPGYVEACKLLKVS